MASKRVAGASLRLLQMGSLQTAKDPLMRHLTPALARSMATEATMKEAASISRSEGADELFALPPTPEPVYMDPTFRRPPPTVAPVLMTVHSFPTMEPVRFEEYPANQLYLPLRRDLLHRAVIYEGDSTRQGTASSKWRSEVRGSGRKIRPQKGTGRARLGDKKSPMLRGGGAAHGPHPRDFSTDLNRKMYDQAWRTALSYRYRRGQLLLIEDGAELEMAEPLWFSKVMSRNRIGNADGRSLIVTSDVRPNLWNAAAGAGHHGKVRTQDEVDVKNMLSLGRVIMEKSVLDFLLAKHSSDLNRTVPTAM